MYVYVCACVCAYVCFVVQAVRRGLPCTSLTTTSDTVIFSMYRLSEIAVHTVDVCDDNKHIPGPDIAIAQFRHDPRATEAFGHIVLHRRLTVEHSVHMHACTIIIDISKI